jgi:hypothetical protein
LIIIKTKQILFFSPALIILAVSLFMWKEIDLLFSSGSESMNNLFSINESLVSEKGYLL